MRILHTTYKLIIAVLILIFVFQVLKFEENNIKALIRRCTCCVKTKNWEIADRDLKKIKQLEPESEYYNICTIFSSISQDLHEKFCNFVP